MEWLILCFALPLYFVMCYLGYSESLRRSSWFMPFCISINLLTSTLWFLAIKYIDNKNKIFFYSLCWDAVMIATACFVPIFLFNLNLNKTTIAGVFFMILGLFLIKIYMPR